MTDGRAGAVMNRILVADRPSPVIETVRAALAGQSDLELELAIGSDLELMLSAAEAEADLVVIAMSGGAVPPLAERLLDEYPALTVLALDVERAEGILQTIASGPEAIEDLAGPRLTAVLRSAAAG
ncbi:hypothetical protein ACWEOO_26120 [Kribbella sp. NPDC004138]